MTIAVFSGGMHYDPFTSFSVQNARLRGEHFAGVAARQAPITFLRVYFIVVIFTSGKQQMLVEEDSRLAAASVVGIGSPSSPFPHRRHHHQPHLSPVLLYVFILKSREIAAQLLASHGQHRPP